MLAHTALIAIFDLVSDTSALVALTAHNLHLAGVDSCFALYDAALFALTAGFHVSGHHVDAFHDYLALAGNCAKHCALLTLVLT